MRHKGPQEAVIQRLFRATRTIAVIGASPRSTRHSYEAVSYLHHAGYDVIPVRPDRAPVAALPTFATLDDFRGSVDLVVIFRRPGAVVDHIHQAAARGVHALWLQPGVWSREAEEAVRLHDLTLVKDCCVIDEHRHLIAATGEPTAGHPRNTASRKGSRG